MYVKRTYIHTFPSLVGQTVIPKQAVLLTLLPRSSSLPNILSDFCWIRSALQWRDRAGISPVFPIKPSWAPALLM